MTQNQGASTVVDKQTTATTEFLQHLEDQVVELSPDDKANFAFQLLEDATENIVSYAKWLANQKQILTKFDYKQLLTRWGWKAKEEKLYLKVAATFDRFLPQNLVQVEPATIFQLARGRKKYQCVLDALLKLPQITQEKVRSLIEATRQPKQPKTEKPSIWRRTKNGGRYCQIPPIHEQETGVTLQQMMDEEGLTAQSIITEAVALRQAYREGRLVLVNDAPPQDIESTTEEDGSTDETQLDADTVCTDDTWSFEPEPEEYEGTAFKPTLPTHSDSKAPSYEELLIETFQTASEWQEIRAVLKDCDEYKQQAWDALTPLEQRRVMAIMPLEIQKLLEAKKAGKIIDFRELREGLYQVQHEGCLFWEVVSDSRLDAFLTQLQLN
jgi:hypothetical protein